jgi:hypothetical protein
MTPDDALAEVRRRAAGRTRYDGQPRPVDELLAEEVERLRAELATWSEVGPDGATKAAISFYGPTVDLEVRPAVHVVPIRALENDRG